MLTSDTDVALVPDWLSRLPFTSVAVSLPTPLSLHDGRDLCHYIGFIAAGIRHDPASARSEGTASRHQTINTRYGPITEGDGIRFLWLYAADQDPTSRCQTVTVELRGELAATDRTLTDLIAAQRKTAEHAGQHWGDELPALVPLSVQLLLYLTAQEPDLDWVPPEQMSRPHQLRTARVANVGWRVGAALRTWQHAATRARPTLARPLAQSVWFRLTSAGRTGTGYASPHATRLDESPAVPAVSRGSTGSTSFAGTRPRRSTPTKLCLPSSGRSTPTGPTRTRRNPAGRSAPRANRLLLCSLAAPLRRPTPCHAGPR